MSDRSLDVDRARVLLHEAAIRYEGAAQIFPGDRDALLSDAAFCRTLASQLAALPDAAELQRDNAKWAQDFAAFAALNRSEKEAYERTVASLESQLAETEAALRERPTLKEHDRLAADYAEERKTSTALESQLEEARREHRNEIDRREEIISEQDAHLAELKARLSTVERERDEALAKQWPDTELRKRVYVAESTAREAAAMAEELSGGLGNLAFSHPQHGVHYQRAQKLAAALRPSETSSENQK